MSLKFVIESLQDVPEPLREHYVPEGCKFHLATQGDHPKMTEFRGTTTQARKDLDALKAKYDGVEWVAAPCPEAGRQR